MIHQASIGCSRTFCGVSCDGWPYAFSADAAKVLKYLFLSIIAWQSWFRRNIHLHFAFCASLTKAMVHCRSICTCDTQLWHFVFVTLLPTGRSRVIKKFSSRSQSKTSWAPMKQTISQHQWYRGSSHDFWWLGFDSSHVEKNGDSTRLESRFSQNDSTRVTVNDSSQSHFYKISEFLMGKPSSFAHKEMRIFCFSDD